MKYVKLSLTNITKKKLRSFLTMLGIIIGVAAVIILLGIMQGVQQEIVSSYEEMGITTIETYTYYEKDALSINEIEKIVSKSNGIILSYSPVVNIYEQNANYSSTYIDTSIKGVDIGYFNIKKLQLFDGRFLSYMDIKNNVKVCILGSYVSEQFFKEQSPIGKNVCINGEEYKVVGVLVDDAGNSKGSNDDVIYIPYLSAQQISKSIAIDNILFSIKDKEYIQDATELIESYLLNKTQNAQNYSIYCANELIDNLNSMLNKFKMALIGVAFISLLVGGIGIMNIMYVSVSERTKEIAIREAIGASPKDILIQFLVEAIVLSFLGGIIGIALGVTVYYIVSFVVELPATFPFVATIISTVISMSIGIIFGYLPAKNASELNLIDALKDK